MIWDYLNFPMLNLDLHRQVCKYGPHLYIFNVSSTIHQFVPDLLVIHLFWWKAALMNLSKLLLWESASSYGKVVFRSTYKVFGYGQIWENSQNCPWPRLFHHHVTLYMYMYISKERFLGKFYYKQSSCTWITAMTGILFNLGTVSKKKLTLNVSWGL